jgi:fatty acid desaturase
MSNEVLDPSCGAVAPNAVPPVEWSTVALIAGCYAVWAGAGLFYAEAPLVAVVVLALAVALHSSLQHETIHRHPTRHAGLNEALVFLPIGLLVPYRRYRDLHLLHHVDERLTDPYDDPESYYLALREWERLPDWARTLLDWNNRLGVRLLIGPAISATGFLIGDARRIGRTGGRDGRKLRSAWMLHGIGLLAVMLWVQAAAMPAWAYLAGVYIGLSLLSVRAFCEHRWAEQPDHRTVIIENSALGLLFLNNNLHFVHHRHPGLPWYALPAVYCARRAEWQAANGGYVFDGYGAVLRRFGTRSRGPVLHPHRIAA